MYNSHHWLLPRDEVLAKKKGSSRLRSTKVKLQQFPININDCIGYIRKLVYKLHGAFFLFSGGIQVSYALSPVQELPMLANYVFLTYPLFPW